MLLLSQSGDNIPDNLPTEPTIQEIYILMIIISVVIFVVMSLIILAVYFKKHKEIKGLKELSKKDITEEEQQLINNYRNLNIQGKNIINTTCKSLIDNNLKSNNNDGG